MTRIALTVAVHGLLLAAQAIGQTSQPASTRRAAPAIEFPLRHAYTRLHPDRVTVLEPRFDPSPLSDCNLLVVYSGGAVMPFDPAQNRPLWPQPLACENEPTLLAVNDRQLILASMTQVFAVARSNGRIQWRVGEKTSTDPNDDPEWQSAWIDHVLTGERLYSVNDRHDLFCIDTRNGALAWRVTDGPHYTGMLAADARHVVTFVENADGASLTCRSAETGVRITGAPFDGGGTIQSLQMTNTGIVLAISSTAITALHPISLRPNWRIPGQPVIFTATLLIDPSGIFVSDDGRSLARFDLEKGTRVWRTPRFPDRNENVLWTEFAGTRIMAATPRIIGVFDLAGGRKIWQSPGDRVINGQPPIVTRDAILTHEFVPPTTRRSSGQPVPLPILIRRFPIESPTSRSVQDAAFTTQPIESFGGLYVRDHVVIVLDGQRLVGYVDASIIKQP